MQCKGGCGFWGQEDKDGYCSVCYKKHFPGGAAPATASPPTTLPSTNAPSVPAAAPARARSDSVDANGDAVPNAVPKPKEPSESRFAYLRGVPEAQLTKGTKEATIALAREQFSRQWGAASDRGVCDVVWVEAEKALRLHFANPVNKEQLEAPLAMLGAGLGADGLTTQLLADTWCWNDTDEGVRTVTLEELQKLVQNGTVKPDTEVKHAALYPAWTAVKDVKELQDPADDDVEMGTEQIEEMQASKAMEFSSWAAKHFPTLLPILKIQGFRWAVDKRTKRQQVVELLAPLKQDIATRAAFFDKVELLQKHDAMHPDCVMTWRLGQNVQVYNKKREEWFIDGRVIGLGEGAKEGKCQIEYDQAKKKKWANWASMRPALVNVPSSKKRKQAEEGKRCWHCNKRLKMINSWECKCLEKAYPSARFCTGCRNPSSHKCPYDHAAAKRAELVKKNPLIAPAKLNKMSPAKK